MFNDLEIFLSEVVTEYRALRILEAYRMIERVKGDIIHSDLATILTTEENRDRIQTVALLEGTALELLIQITAEFGVTLSPDYAIIEMSERILDIITALLTLDDYENPYRIKDICEDGDFSVDTFCELVSEVTNGPEEDYLFLVSDVNPALLDRIVLAASEKIHRISIESIDLTTVDYRKKAIQRLKTSKYYDRNGVVETELVVSGAFGVPPRDLLRTMVDTLYSLPADKLPVALYQLCMASDCPSADIITTAKSLAEIILDDTQFKERQLVAMQLNRFSHPAVEVDI